MTTIDTSSLSAYLGLTSTANTNTTSTTPTDALTALLDDGGSSNSQTSQDPATNVTLSSAALAYLAAATSGSDSTAVTTTTSPAQTATSIANTLRAWFDDQYKTKGITSPYDDNGDSQLDLSKQDRASLVAAATNAQNLFSQDEQDAATAQLQSNFSNELLPYMAIARKTGNYTQLYQAASDYLDKAGTDERATKSWQDAKKAVVDGLAAAKANPGKAPDTGNANDPVRAMLDERESTGSAGSGASAADVATSARAMLDDQENAATDAGETLVFSANESGQQVDFSDFDNRTLAVMALNKDGSFSSEEAFAAKSELNVRTRNSMMNILNPSSGSTSGADMNISLLRSYEGMSDEEKEALGVTSAVTDRLIANMNSLKSLQSAFSGSGAMTNNMMGLSALLANQDGSQQDISMGLAGLMA